MEPKIVEFEEIAVVGMQTFGSPEQGLFPKMWDVLFLCNEEIQNLKSPPMAYGVETYTKEFHEEGKWFYLAGREVTDLDNIPQQMIGKAIPANTYAVFEYRGVIDQRLGELFQYIYKEWLPNSDYDLAGSYDLERYDDRFLGPQNDESVFEVCLPVKPK